MTLVKFKLDIKSQAWIDSNPSKVLDLNEPIFREDGKVAFGDGSAPLSDLVFKPIFSIPSLEYVQSSDNTISFLVNTIYGTYETPLSGSLGFTYPGVRGVYSIIIHNDLVEPTYDTWKKLDGSYVTGQVNYIIAQYLSSTNIIYSIKQIQP